MPATSVRRVLRPLVGARPSGVAVRPAQLTVVSGREHVASEDIATALAREGLLDTTVWLRLDALDTEPHCLLESLICAATYASATAGRPAPVVDAFLDVHTHRRVGRCLAGALHPSSVVVLEDEQPSKASAGPVETLNSFLRCAGSSARAIYLCHGHLQRNINRITGASIDRQELFERLDGFTESGSMYDAASLHRLSVLAEHRSAIINDIIDANDLRDHRLISDLTRNKMRRRGLLHRINARLLPHLTPAELQALTTATRTGYWHHSLNDRSPPAEMTLRPWMVPLEEDWWWLRPMWRRSLTEHLDPTRRTGRRLYSAYRPTMPHRDRAPVRSDPPAEGSCPREVSDAVPRTAPRTSHAFRSATTLASNGTTDDSAPRSPLVVLVRMFGVFEVGVLGVSVPRWHGRLGRSILAYLLLEHQCVARDRLIDVFWPDTDPKCAQNRLRVAVSSLRRSLKSISDQQLIEFRDGNYRLARTCQVSVDVDEFEQSAKAGRLAEAHHQPDEALTAYRRALDCYRGELLAEMPYEEWTLLPREALRVAYLECLGNAASLHVRRGDHSEALSLGWDILAADPAREDAHRLIMRCHAAKGEIHQAQRQFDLCRHELLSILGVEPAPATVELLRSLDTSG